MNLKRLLLIMLTLSTITIWQFTSPISPMSTEKRAIDLPEEYKSRQDLVRCPLSKLEQEFAKNFPGTIETYRYQHGTLIFRSVSGATRKLHDTSTCLKASGFKLGEPKLETDEKGRHWKVYTAQNAKNRILVRSTVTDVGTNQSWSSVEEWFWHAFFTNSSRGYLAITEISDPVREGEFY